LVLVRVVSHLVARVSESHLELDSLGLGVLEKLPACEDLFLDILYHDRFFRVGNKLGPQMIIFHFFLGKATD
jgi:hypothetical protein